MSQKGALLAHLGERLDVQLPERTHRGRPTAEYAGAFAGYRWIKGESLLRVTALSASERESLVKPLATLLRTLHQFGVPATQKFGLSITDRQEELSLRTEKAQVRAGELASSAFAALSARAAEAMTPAPPPCASADYRLVHGDLHAGQILVDPDRRVTALIDWDDARLGDPAYDLQMVYSFVPPSSRPSFWNIYGPFKGHRRARHLALSYGLAFLGRAMRDGDSELADGAASQLHNALR
jgi:aminoglycoside phosphotransferase (APT) family kinase protein